MAKKQGDEAAVSAPVNTMNAAGEAAVTETPAPKPVKKTKPAEDVITASVSAEEPSKDELPKSDSLIAKGKSANDRLNPRIPAHEPERARTFGTARASIYPSADELAEATEAKIERYTEENMSEAEKESKEKAQRSDSVESAIGGNVSPMAPGAMPDLSNAQTRDENQPKNNR